MRDLVLFAIVIGLVPCILLRPWTGILAWFWVGLMVPHGLTWGFMKTFPIADVIGAATLVALVLAKDRRAIPLTREMAIMALFVAYITMTSFFAMNPGGAWDQWEKVLKILLMTFLAPMLIHGERRIVALLFVITFSIGFYGFKGGLFTLSTGGQDMVMGPPSSFLEGNTFIGLAMIMVLPMILVSARLVYRRWIDFGLLQRPIYSRVLGLGLYGVFWLTCIAILGTYSRGAFLGLLVIAPFLFLKMRRKILLAGLAVFAVTVVGVTVPDRLMDRWQTIETYEEDRSSMQRIQAWGANWNMAIERPLLGMGFKNAGLGYDWWVSYANFEGTWNHALSPHSIYFQVMGQHGFGGLAVFLALIGSAFMTLNRIRRTAGRETGKLWLAEYAWAIQVGLVGYLAAGAFLDVAYFDLLYALITLVVIMRRELEEAPGAAASEAVAATDDRSADRNRLRFPNFVADPLACRRPAAHDEQS